MTLRQLYERCPDCNGMGSVSVMDGQGRETEYQCERCVFDGGMVPFNPDHEAAEEAFSERSTDSRSIVDAAFGEATP